MCATSAVSDYYTNTWPGRLGQPNPFQNVNPVQPMSPFSAPVVMVDSETREMMKQVLLMLDKIDKRLGDIECMDDKKAEFMKSVGLSPEDFGG